MLQLTKEKPSGASWVKQLQKLDTSEINSGDYYYRRRLQALLAVDDLVNKTIARLDQHGILDNTYIIYTSDNGFHIGQHRLGPGKRCPYEEDINVPLVIRGPGVPKAATIDFVTTHTDITPAIVQLAGARGPSDFDGVAIPLQGNTEQSSSKQNWEHVQVEFWGASSDEVSSSESSKINTYKAIRVIAQNYSLYYSVWCLEITRYMIWL
jgi:N-acetylglucosamine-6-sulfatase